MQKCPGHCPIFKELLAKKKKKILNRQPDKFTTFGLRNFLKRDHHEADIFPTKEKISNRSIFRKNIGEQTLKICNKRTV